MPNIILRCHKRGTKDEYWEMVCNGEVVARLSVDFYHFMEHWYKCHPARVEVEYVED